jgi:ClpP class serine protease
VTTPRPDGPIGPLAIHPDHAVAAFSWPPREAPAVAPGADVARIRIEGPLSSDDWWGTSYAAIQSRLADAVADQAVRAIVLDIDSPGGTVSGIAETVAAVERAREAKPVIAYVRGMAASAAYWLAAACDRIVAVDTAQAGCVGAICTVLYLAPAMRKMGAEVYRYTSSRTPLKAPEPGTEAFDAERQRLIDAAGDLFLAHLARLRGPAGMDLDAAAELYQRGRMLSAPAAVAAGWVDAVVAPGAESADAWLMHGGSPPPDEPESPFPFLHLFHRAEAAHYPEEGAMPKTPEGAAGAATPTASEAAEAAFLAQIKTLTEANAAAVERAEAAERKLAADAAERAGLAGRVAQLEAQAKAHAEAAERREVAALIDAAVARGAIDPGQRARREAFAAKHGREALAEVLADIPDEAAGPRSVLTSGRVAPGEPPDEVAKAREKAQAEINAATRKGA